MMTSPPLPPSPPDGPPRGTNFSRRKARQPFPPSPAFTRIVVSSMNMRYENAAGPYAVKSDSELFALSRLSLQEKCFRKSALATQLERSEVFIPASSRNFGLRVNPNSQAIEILNADAAISHPFYKMSTQGSRKLGPSLDFRHYSPKTKRPISSPNR